MTITFLKAVIPIIWIGYAAAGFASQYAPEGEIYPFFSWQLFTRVPDRVSIEYSIRVTEFGGRPVSSSRPFHPDDRFLSSRIQPTEYWLMFRNLGIAYRTGNVAAIAMYRAEIEKSFTDYPVRYELVLVTKDAIDYWERQRYITVARVAEFYADHSEL